LIYKTVLKGKIPVMKPVYFKVLGTYPSYRRLTSPGKAECYDEKGRMFREDYSGLVHYRTAVNHYQEITEEEFVAATRLTNKSPQESQAPAVKATTLVDAVCQAAQVDKKRAQRVIENGGVHVNGVRLFGQVDLDLEKGTVIKIAGAEIKIN
jgi:hypothetical protein